MKEFFKPARILFYLLSTITFFLLGMIISAALGLAEGQGLAGGAIIFFYGVLSGIGAFILSIIMSNRIIPKTIKKLNISLFIILLVCIFSLYLRQSARGQSRIDHSLDSASKAILKFNDDLGLGMLTPDFIHKPALYFYNPNPNKTVHDHVPFDSLTFIKTERGFDISYAPPWFAPAHLKLDYEIIFIKFTSLSDDFAEIVVNQYTGQRSYVDKSSVNLHFWPEFWLKVNSVEPIQGIPNPLRSKPLDHASEVTLTFDFLKVLRVRREWLQVEAMDENYQSQGSAWIKWQENGQLLIKYSLLS